jgi:sugar lactone lactonase YvrE
MHRLLIAILIFVLPLPALAVQQVRFITGIETGRTFAVAVDEEGNVYTGQKDGTVKVMTSDGREVITLGGKEILKRPAGIAIYNDKIFVTDESLGKVVVFSKDGKHLESYGERGSGPKQFNKPAGIFIYSGVIYVADRNNSRVQVLGPNGIFIGVIGVEGPEDTLLKEPTDVAVDYRGRIYVVDGKKNEVIIYRQSGKYYNRLSIAGNINSIAMDRDGFFIADTDKSKIIKFSFKGKRLFAFGSKGEGRAQFKKISGLHVDKTNGKVYIADAKRSVLQVLLPKSKNRIGKQRLYPPPTSVKWLWSTDVRAYKILWNGEDTLYAVDEKNKAVLVVKDGKVKATITIPKCSPVSVALDNKGLLWVLDKKKNRVIKLDGRGNEIYSFGSSGRGEGYLKKPSDIAISDKGIVYIADSGNGRVQAFNTDGIFLNIIGEKEKRPDGESLLENPVSIALDKKGSLYVLDDKTYRVAVFSSEGKLIQTFGKEGDGIGDFYYPKSIAVTENEVFILDTGTNSIKVFSLKGKFLREFGAGGTGNGDFNEPSSITFIDDVNFLVSDTENNRIQALLNVYTPSAPSKLASKSGMRRVDIKWKSNPETYADSYRIYRATNKASGFNELTITNESTYTDTNVKPIKKYHYIVAAIARDGNESPLSKVVKATPTKNMPSPPSDLKADTESWSIALTWKSNKEAFVTSYSVYRNIAGGFEEVGRVKTTSFTESGLKPQTSYTYAVSAISNDNVESKVSTINVTTRTATRPPLEIDVLRMEDVFSNTYKIYENEGIGKMKVSNNTDDYISKLKIAFTILEFMDFASEVEIQNLPPRESQDVVLKAVFNNKILTVTEDTPVQTEIKVSYYKNENLKTYTKNYTLNIYEKHKMMWDVRDRFATFVTPKDAVVLDFSRSIVTQYPYAEDPLLKAATIFDSLSMRGLKYMQDPSNPYQVTSGKTDFVDYIQYPRETMRRKSGDCDDLVGLYAASLESLGIRTMVLEVPGHMLMMFSTGIKGGLDSDTMDDMFVVHDNQLWVPVETTMTGASFIMAWETGSKTYNQWAGKGLTMMDIRDAWKKFKPASLPQSDWKATTVAKADVEKKHRDELSALRRIRARLKSGKYFNTLKTKPNDINALVQIGIIYAKEGDYGEALNVFKKARSLDQNNAAIINNIGNIRFLNGKNIKALESYKKAAELDPEDPHVWVNLARCFLKLEMKDEAIKAFKKAYGLDPNVSKKYRTMSLKLMGPV